MTSEVLAILFDGALGGCRQAERCARLCVRVCVCARGGAGVPLTHKALPPLLLSIAF